MRNIKLYFNLIFIKLFGSKESKDEMNKMGKYYDDIITDYMHRNNINNKRKAKKLFSKELKKVSNKFYM